MNVAVREIDKGNYSSALTLLEKASIVGNDGFSISFYSGVAYQELGQYKNAINSFTEVVRHGDNLLVEQSEWYIGLCYLRIEERDKALKQFKDIVARNGYYRDKSSKLLKQLD
jgi:tetratricopeptide (TPR) repeat protein